MKLYAKGGDVALMDKETEIILPDTHAQASADEALPKLLETTKKANEDRDADDTEPKAAEPPKKKRGRPRKNPPKEAEITSEDASGSAADGAAAVEAGENDAACGARTAEAVASGASDSEPISGAAEVQDEGGLDEDNLSENTLPKSSSGEFIIPIPEKGELFPLFTPEEIICTEPLDGSNGGNTEEYDATEPQKSEGEDEDIAYGSVKEDPPKRLKKKRPEREIGSRGIDTLFDFLELFIFTFVAVLLVTTFLFRHSVVSGDSMMNTLHDEDKLIISDLFYTPDYGDIVVVEDHTAGITSPIVKRVIALEGDTVRVTYDAIWVNGQALVESEYVFTNGVQYFYDLSDHIYFKDYEAYAFVPGEYYEFRVPADEIYVLGDHRNDSTDSRKRGTVREDSVLGHVIVRFYPFSDFKFFG